MKSFVLRVVCDAWGFVSNLMRDGGAVWDVATWHMLIEGINGMTLGFLAAFQFLWVFGFKKKKLFLSFTLVFLSRPTPSICSFCFVFAIILFLFR